MIIALLDHQPVGCVLAPTWDTTTGGIAFLGVHSEHRKSGIAAQLGATAIARIRSSICITSLPVNVPAYEKQGFVEGSGIQYWKFSGSLPQPKGKVSEEPPTVSELAKIDTAYTGLDRGRLWQCFIDQKSRFLSIHAGDKLVAWTIVHSFDQQCTLAPLYAETKDQARDLVLRAVEMSDELVIEADSTENAEEVFGELGFEKTIQAVVSAVCSAMSLAESSTVHVEGNAEATRSRESVCWVAGLLNVRAENAYFLENIGSRAN